MHFRQHHPHVLRNRSHCSFLTAQYLLPRKEIIRSGTAHRLKPVSHRFPSAALHSFREGSLCLNASEANSHCTGRSAPDPDKDAPLRNILLFFWQPRFLLCASVRKLLLMQLHSLFHICLRQAPGRWWNPHRRLQVQVLSCHSPFLRYFCYIVICFPVILPVSAGPRSPYEAGSEALHR